MSTELDLEAVLRRRAELLAQRPAEEDHAPTLTLLGVRIEGRVVAFDGSRVMSVLRNDTLCRLPAAGGVLIGLVPARGHVVPVTDLGSLLDGVPPNRNREYVVLLAAPERAARTAEGTAEPVEAAPVGFLVDDVLSVTQVPEHEIGALHDRDGAAPALERGLTPDGTVLLDHDVLMSDPRLRPAAELVPSPT